MEPMLEMRMVIDQQWTNNLARGYGSVLLQRNFQRIGMHIGVQRSIRILSLLQWPRVVVQDRVCNTLLETDAAGNRVSYHVQRLPQLRETPQRHTGMFECRKKISLGG